MSPTGRPEGEHRSAQREGSRETGALAQPGSALAGATAQCSGATAWSSGAIAWSSGAIA
jgi:hypothetical protein